MGAMMRLFCVIYLCKEREKGEKRTRCSIDDLLNDAVGATARDRFRVKVFFDELLPIDGYLRRAGGTFFSCRTIESLDAVEIEIDGLVRPLSVTNEPLNDDIDKRSGGRVIVVGCEAIA